MFARCIKWLSVAAVCCTSDTAWVQQLGYPAPRFPNLPSVVGDSDILQAARIFVKRKPGGGLPGYEIKPGEKALLLVTPLYDPKIVEAFAQAIREAGASADVFYGDVSDVIPSLGDRDWGYLENPMYLFLGSGQKYVLRIELGGGLPLTEVPKLVALKNYDILISGLSTTHAENSYRWEEIPWQRADELLASAQFGFPPEVGKLTYQLAWEQLRQARRVHVTDPEGTDITWNLPAYISKIDKAPQFWREYMCMPERLNGDAGNGYFRNDTRHTDIHSGLESAESMRQVDVNGVVAGTINHVGAFPQIKVYIRHSHVERVEGGGRFGDELRKVIKQYENTNWPGDQPKPGFGWVEECSVGVIPSEIRPRGSMSFPLGTYRERRRSGIFHWSFGAQTSPEMGQELEQQGLPDGHFDVHNNFGTMTLETADGKKIVFVDKGHLTALDDPKLRELAAHFANPDELLREAWIPPVPGINVPGDYMTDYARNPVPWIAAEYDRFFAKH
jgi:hypothetical protein